MMDEPSRFDWTTASNAHLRRWRFGSQHALGGVAVGDRTALALAE